MDINLNTKKSLKKFKKVLIFLINTFLYFFKIYIYKKDQTLLGLIHFLRSNRLILPRF